VFQDRLVNDEDRNWFDNLLREKMKSDFDAKIDEVINLEPILYADLLSANVENKIYCEVTDHLKVMFLQFLQNL
jgi:dynein heavy chain